MKTILNLLAASFIVPASGCASSDKTTELKNTDRQKQIYVFESDGNGFNTKTVFYDNGSEVVAFDSQFTPALAQQAIAFLRTKSSRPLTHLVITHPNPDKFNGISVFQQAGAKVIASNATAKSMPVAHAYKKYFFVNIAKMFTEETYPKLGTVDVTFERNLDLQLRNGDVVALRELAQPGVSSNQTVAHIPAVNALIVGDLVHHQAHAWLEGGIVNGKPLPTINSWIADLQELNRNFAPSNPIVFGGRGETVALNVAIPQQITYLRTADQIVTDYVTGLQERKGELTTDAAAGHYANIQKALERAFPAYTLGYMIQYGVYGLALTK